MKKIGFTYFLLKSVSQRKGRIFIAALSVSLAVAIITGLAGITAGIREKLGSELKAYGANLIVSSRDGGYLDMNDLSAISQIEGVGNASGHVYGRISVGGVSVEITGIEADELRSSGSRLDGSWPVSDHEILAGINLRKALDLDVGKTVRLADGPGLTPSSSPAYDFVVTGFIERGGAEDNTFILSLSQAWEVLGADRKLSAILVRGRSGDLDAIRSSIENTIKGTNVKTIRQVAAAEASLLAKIQLLMTMVSIVVLFASIISIMSTMGANLLERREEIGLMKAIGATRSNIKNFYFAEAVLTGLAGGVAGFALGYLFAQAVSWGAFSSFISIPIYIIILAIGSGIIISLIASHFPVHDALKYQPSVILREE